MRCIGLRHYTGVRSEAVLGLKGDRLATPLWPLPQLCRVTDVVDANMLRRVGESGVIF